MTSVLIFLLVLSVLIFVHELGHFVAAKMCNVYVDRFSIGMPPRVFGFKWGETDYCIGAMPFGGFVKMAGQEDSPLSEEERARDYGTVPPERWFNNRPVYQRIFILLAGPFMNLVLAVIVYAGILAWGMMVPEGEDSARIGDIAKDSAAQTAPLYPEKPGAALADYTGDPVALGWKTGDVVVSVDGKPVHNIADVAVEAVLGGEKARLVLLDRPNPDGSMTRYASVATPKKMEDDDAYPRFGVMPFSTALVGDLLEGMPGKEAGLKTDDIIERLDGEVIDRATFIAKVEKVPEGTPLRLGIRRGDERIEITVTPRTIGRLLGVAFGAADGSRGDAAENAKPVVLDVPEEYTKKHGLQRKDVIATINGEPATLKRLADLERENPNGSLKLGLERPAVLFGAIQQAASLEVTVPVEAVRAVGIGLKTKLVFQRTPPAQVIQEAFAWCWKDVDRTVGTLYALVTQTVSMKDIGGPVMIFSITTQAAEEGLGWLLRTMAFISVNLCVFNLIPLPVLDGGQIVVNLLEAVRRRPVSPAFLERYQMAGLFMIVLLMLFVTWNDIGRLIDGLRP